jgi:hypothetical protein
MEGGKEVRKMALHTYTVTLNGKVVGIKAKKEIAEAIGSKLKMPLNLRRHFRQITGVVGEKESTTLLWSPFGPDKPLTDEEGYKVALEAYIQGLPAVLSPENVGPYLKQAAEICNKHMPVSDERETKEQVILRQANYTVAQHERDLEAAAWRARWCKPEEVAIPEGMMAVYLEINFSDSDSMVDYFCPHHAIGPGMLLALVPKQAEKQAIARRVLEGYPELAKLEWGWHTDNYSMGHGNYLESSVFGTEKHHAYDGREEVAVWYEIRFNAYDKSMRAYRDYPGTQPLSSGPVQIGEKVDHVTIRRNEGHNGIEVVFPAKPEVSVLEALKALGFRWSRPQGLWYARYSEELLKQVKNLVGNNHG